MARNAETPFLAGIVGATGAAFTVILLVAAASGVPVPANAYLLSDDSTRNPCRVSSSSDVPEPLCGWTFEAIARVRTVAASPAEELANLGRLERMGFTTSDLTLEETITEPVAAGGNATLTWDREVGIADQLSAAMGIAVDTSALSSTHFLLMPATFNEAFLADFIDFEACATTHTFIFAGALDGRSDAPYVTHRWEEMKLDVCLDMAGADCSKKDLKVEPARLYFRTDWPCRYAPRRTGGDAGPR